MKKIKRTVQLLAVALCLLAPLLARAATATAVYTVPMNSNAVVLVPGFWQSNSVATLTNLNDASNALLQASARVPYATNASIAANSTNAQFAGYSTNSGTAGYSTNAGLATNALWAAVATNSAYATNAAAALTAGTATNLLGVPSPVDRSELAGSNYTTAALTALQIASSNLMNAAGVGAQVGGSNYVTLAMLSLSNFLSMLPSYALTNNQTSAIALTNSGNTISGNGANLTSVNAVNASLSTNTLQTSFTNATLYGSGVGTNWTTFTTNGVTITNTVGGYINLYNGIASVSGRVGIGTTNPTNLLHIYSTVDDDLGLYVQKTVGNAIIKLESPSKYRGSYIDFENASSTNDWYVGRLYKPSVGNDNFGIGLDSNQDDAKLVIDVSGNLLARTNVFVSGTLTTTNFGGVIQAQNTSPGSTPALSIISWPSTGSPMLTMTASNVAVSGYVQATNGMTSARTTPWTVSELQPTNSFGHWLSNYVDIWVSLNVANTIINKKITP